MVKTVFPNSLIIALAEVDVKDLMVVAFHILKLAPLLLDAINANTEEPVRNFDSDTHTVYRPLEKCMFDYCCTNNSQERCLTPVLIQQHPE